MDACAMPPPSKRLIFSENQRLDIISNLQDDILHNILKFVSAEDATRTRILSKRWLNLRTSSPTIIMVDKPYSRFRIGLVAIDRALICHDPSDIRKLCLELSSPVDLSHLRLWIDVAKAHNVQSLDLNFPVDGNFHLPPRLYDLQNLVELKLSLNCVLKVPKSTKFSGLRSLHLSNIIFYGHLSFLRIFASCLVLEKLALVNCHWENVGSLEVMTPMLRSLTIVQNLARMVPLRCFICFSAPNLSSFICSSDLKVSFCLHETPLLESASLDITLSHIDTQLSVRAVILVSDFQYVKYLSVSFEIFSCFFASRDYQQNLQPFENLTHLKIDTEYSVVFMEVFLDFLEKVPNLEFLDLSKGVRRDHFFRGHLMEMRVPYCFNSSLKKIRITNFEGRTVEMALLKFLLQNATALERLLIYFSDQLLMNPTKLIYVSHSLQLLPRGSDKLLIYYSD